MATLIRKTIRVPQKVIRDIEASRGDRNFSQIAIWGLRAWLRRHRRRRNSQIIARAFAQMPEERLADEARLAEQASRFPLEVLEDYKRGHDNPTSG